ncbi:hypothetical protein [Bradyrhizobium sp. SSUT77]|uniref:hypothetical protein n=1 Tax=Bradyrhizobium sp. SSUT77 TaxID=3040603 RepID=UPI002447ED6A|nr:hypothetical protein [Bradyrhizobium sp. SSUT77]MDH2342392.1 hypothetical protein [Bradyrhizobium sp. SSUT77]
MAVVVLLAGKILADFDNLHHYTDSTFYGPYLGFLLRLAGGTCAISIMALPPTLFVLIFTEALKVRGKWFYVLATGGGAALLDLACTQFDYLDQARSFCVRLSFSELATVTLAGMVAGYAFWRMAGRQAGDWGMRSEQVPVTSV